MTVRSVSGSLAVAAVLPAGVGLPSGLTWADSGEPPRAVSQQNSKLSMGGGVIGDDGSGTIEASLSLPLGNLFGLQFDGAAGLIGKKWMRGGGVHLFTRDPSRYLLGVYAGHHVWNRIHISRLAGEAELYADRFTFSALAGWEYQDVPRSIGGLVVLNRDQGRAFANANLSFYPKDNIRLWGGYRYENKTSAGSFGAEIQLPQTATPITLFAQCSINQHGKADRVMAGLRLYFGGDASKSLIRRHREDDPPSYIPTFPALTTQAQAVNQQTCQGQPFTPGGNFDNNLCTIDTCQGDKLTFTRVNPDDNNACTADSCDLATGNINNVPTVGAPCDDGDPGTINDACTAGATCVGQAPP